MASKFGPGKFQVLREDGSEVALSSKSEIETSNVVSSKLQGQINELKKEISDIKYRLDKLENK